MGRKPNKNRDKIAQQLICDLSKTENVLNLRKTFLRLAIKFNVSETYVRNIWYKYLTPFNKATKETKLIKLFNEGYSFCFYTVGLNSNKAILNRKIDTHHVKYRPE